MSLLDKAVLEIGAGTGLLSVVASLLGKSMIMKSIWTLHNMWNNWESPVIQLIQSNFILNKGLYQCKICQQVLTLKS